MTILEFMNRHGASPEQIDADAALVRLMDAMELGLAGKGEIPMLPSYLSAEGKVPAERRCAVLDAGGTNLRTARAVFDKDGTCRLEGLHKQPMPGTEGELTAARLYEAMAERGLILLAHTGDHRYPYSQPERMARALDKVPSLTAICAHFGGWSIWNQAWKVLAGRSNVYVDTSSSLYAITPEEAVKIIHRYGASQVLFATDMPMWDPVKELERFNRLDLTEEERELILHKNFERLMGETDGE